MLAGRGVMGQFGCTFALCSRYEHVTSAKTFFTINVLDLTTKNSRVSGGLPMNSRFGRYREWIKSSSEAVKYLKIRQAEACPTMVSRLLAVVGQASACRSWSQTQLFHSFSGSGFRLNRIFLHLEQFRRNTAPQRDR